MAPTRYKLGGAIKVVNQTGAELKVEKYSLHVSMKNLLLPPPGAGPDVIDPPRAY